MKSSYDFQVLQNPSGQSISYQYLLLFYESESNRSFNATLTYSVWITVIFLFKCSDLNKTPTISTNFEFEFYYLDTYVMNKEKYI